TQRVMQPPGRVLPWLVVVEEQPEPPKARQRAEDLAADVGAAQSESRKAPLPQHQPVKRPFHDQRFQAGGGRFPAYERPVTLKSKVLGTRVPRAGKGVGNGPTDQPDRLARANLRNNDPAGQELVSGWCEEPGAARSIDGQPPPAQVGDQLIAGGVPQPA